MSVVEKVVVDRKFVLAQAAASSTYFDILALPAPCTPRRRLSAATLVLLCRALTPLRCRQRRSRPRDVERLHRRRAPRLQVCSLAMRPQLPLTLPAGDARSSATRTKLLIPRCVCSAVASLVETCHVAAVPPIDFALLLHGSSPRVPRCFSLIPFTNRCRCWASFKSYATQKSTFAKSQSDLSTANL